MQPNRFRTFLEDWTTKARYAFSNERTITHRLNYRCVMHITLFQITKVLLQNASVWRVKKDGPILVVCYTNHALDQFLEEIHEFHPQGIVRVGGRSQSEVMQKCSLTKRKREMIQVTS